MFIFVSVLLTSSISFVFLHLWAYLRTIFVYICLHVCQRLRQYLYFKGG